MNDGRIVTIDLKDKLSILRELNVKKPADVKSAGLIIINFSGDFMLNCIDNGLNIKFLDEMTKALKLFSDKDLVLISLYSYAGVTVMEKFMELLKFHKINVKDFIGNFDIYSNIYTENLDRENILPLALRTNCTNLTLLKLNKDKKPVVDIVNEYLRYLDKDIPTFTERKNISADVMSAFLSEMSDTIKLNTPKDYSKYFFNEWYLKKLAGDNV